MITYADYNEAYRNMPIQKYIKWFQDQLVAEYKIGTEWFPCIPLSDKCTEPFQDYFISVITQNGTHLHLKEDEYRL